MLAILDHNNHVGRAVRVREDGEPYAQAQVSRRTKQWVAYEKKNVLKSTSIFQARLILTVLLKSYII